MRYVKIEATDDATGHVEDLIQKLDDTCKRLAAFDDDVIWEVAADSPLWPTINMLRDDATEGQVTASN